MFRPDQYELLDFGDGRTLERFGRYLIDRPSAAAETIAKAEPRRWKMADARYERTGGDSGVWKPSDALPQSWTIVHEGAVLELKPTPFGHLGVFPEQAANWDWIAAQMRRAGRPLVVLNLFAYTGGSTLAAAAAGAAVVHVDSARNVVAWARRNATLSGLADAPIRWIVEDAQRFVRRELRRGKRYDAVILDPPSYGHGPKGQTWQIGQHLASLLTMCGELTEDRRAFILLTCHWSGLGPAELEAIFADAVFGGCQSGAKAKRLTLRTAKGRQLPSGLIVRWPA